MNDAVLINDGVGIGRECAFQRHIRIQFPVLIEIYDAQIVRPANRPSRWLYIAAHEAKQRRLAATVRTDEANSHSWLDQQMNAGKQGALRNREFNFIELEQLLRPPLGG